jgi:hypothetical protein
MKYYLAGPMSGVPQHNLPLFYKVAKELRDKGYKIISPAELDDDEVVKAALNDLNGDIHVGNGSKIAGYTWGDFLARDVKVVADMCDGIILLPNWEKSKGARLECFVAVSCGYPMLEYRGGELWPIDNEFALDHIFEEMIQ